MDKEGEGRGRGGGGGRGERVRGWREEGRVSFVSADRSRGGKERKRGREGGREGGRKGGRELKGEREGGRRIRRRRKIEFFLPCHHKSLVVPLFPYIPEGKYDSEQTKVSEHTHTRWRILQPSFLRVQYTRTRPGTDKPFHERKLAPATVPFPGLLPDDPVYKTREEEA